MEFSIIWQNKNLKIPDSFRQKAGLKYAMELEQRGSLMRLRIRGLMQDVNRDDIIRFLAEMIAGPVQTCAIEILIENSLDGLNGQGKQLVCDLTLSKLAEQGMDASYPNYIHTIEQRLSDCIQSGQSLHIEGFLCFRMRDYAYAWAQSMDDVVNRVIERYEEAEYIEALKNILAEQESLFERAVLSWLPNGSYCLDCGKWHQVCDGKSGRLAGWGMSPEDELLCHLLIIAPQELLIKHPETLIAKPVFTILRRLFGERMTLVYGE